MKKIFLTLVVLGLLLMNCFPLAYGLSFEKSKVVEGFLTSVGEKEVQIEEYGGDVYKLVLEENAAVKIDNRDAKLSDFRVGMEVYGRTRDSKLFYIEGYSTSNLGYIKEGGKYRRGTIKSIDRNQITVKLPWNKEEIYYTFPGTIITKDKKAVTPEALYVGDSVKLYFDEIDTTVIGRIEIERENSVRIKDLYRGNIKFSDFIDDSINFENLEELKNGRWREKSPIGTITHSSDTPIYMGGTKIPQSKLKYLGGKRTYMVVKDFFGQDKIERMVIQNLYEKTYSDKIEKINWYAGNMELSNKANINFDEGTIIIKSGRLVDSYSLNAGTDAFIVADGRNNQKAADVIYIYNEDINNSSVGQAYIYAGELEEISKNKVILDDFYLLQKNEWESFRDEKELFYDEDTYIYDLEKKDTITSEEFFQGEYSIDDDNRKSKKDRDWHAYVYTDGDRIASILITKKLDSLNSQRVTNGRIEEVEEHASVGWRAYLKDSKDWSPRKDQWVVRRSSLRIMLKEAMIIKNNKLISPKELKPEDRLYLVRNNSEAKIIIVK